MIIDWTRRRCTCKHIVTVHAIGVQGMRSKCSAARCGCRLFVAAEAVDRG